MWWLNPDRVSVPPVVVVNGYEYRSTGLLPDRVTHADEMLAAHNSDGLQRGDPFLAGKLR